MGQCTLKSGTMSRVADCRRYSISVSSSFRIMPNRAHGEELQEVTRYTMVLMKRWTSIGNGIVPLIVSRIRTITLRNPGTFDRVSWDIGSTITHEIGSRDGQIQ